MLTLHFSPVYQFGTTVTIESKIEGQTEKREVIPNSTNGSIGKLVKGDVIKITIAVEGKDHHCYILNPSNLQEQIDRKEIGLLPEELNLFYYEKKMTVTNYLGKLCVAPWPNNMFCIDIGDEKFSIGVCVQNDEFFLVNEQYETDNKLFIPGEVKWFSLLRGFGAVATKCLDSRIHWTVIPWLRANGLKFLKTGEMIFAKKVVKFEYTNSTLFESEVKEAILVE